uniref:Endonuclease V n=2 Tax=Mucochytrium quahogii TaxID=96639 RepID=A0A7S2RKM7_9STRA|mmetsp:Transcript_3466/g.5008  ORF Transcript_3466/g.5008 Transcript_3466/m.5008 type:complete len:251 (+) Transcript_3466:47-799(+)
MAGSTWDSQSLKSKELSWGEEQLRLKCKLELEDRFDDDHVGFVAGVDISFVKDSNRACASLVVTSYPSLELVYSDYEAVEMTEPYISGFLAFREVTFLVKLFDRLKSKRTKDASLPWPDVCLIDGNGILHSKGFGLASHLGVLIDCPTIGVGKTLFCTDGLDSRVVDMKAFFKGNIDEGYREMKLIGDSGSVWGAAVCTKGTTKPIFVSQGHRVSLNTCVDIVKNCCKHRIPEPVRQADLLSRDWLRKHD